MERMLDLRRFSGCEFTTSICEDAIAYQNGTDSPPVHRPPGQVSPWPGYVGAPQESEPLWAVCPLPSLTSRGRQLTGGVEALIRDSHD